jgi:hypothetical protein
MNLGSNISNATGSIVPLYPTNTSVPVNITQLLLAATFSVDLQIKPGASAFDITAVSALPTGVATIHVDPPHGVWQATLAVPSAQARQYNFSGATDPVYDLNTCQQSATGVQCMAFPGNIVPASRIDPIAESAFSAMPLPTSTGNPNGAYTTSGSIPADGHLVIGSSQLNQLSTFGSFQELGATGVSGVDTLEFQLFADGLLLDSETVTAQVQ